MSTIPAMMPPRLNVACNALKPARRKTSETFICPSCSLWRLSQLPRKRASLSKPQARRHASTITPVTSINAVADIPPENKELFKALEAVKSGAASYIHQSRLQLALYGLAAEDTTVRVAVLSLDNPSVAKRLVKALLADPLAESGAWEQELESDGDGRTLILRYGEEGDPLPNENPLAKTILIPSTLLRKHNLEILITSINIDVSSPGRSLASESPRDAILIPTLQIPTSFSGRHTLVAYPVHKAIVVGKGVGDAVAYGRFIGKQVDESTARDMVKVVVHLPAPETEASQETTASTLSVDIQLANSAISTFRESVSNSIAYERGWFRSGLAPLQTWLVEGSDSSTSIKPALSNLLTSILGEARTSIVEEESQRLSELLSTTVPAATKASILSETTAWAERSHRELRNQLDEAFAGRQWHKIAWWKLFFRVDDVTMITSDVLERRWLLDAEKGIIFVAGRIKEAGFAQGATEIGPITSSARPELVEKKAAEDLEISTTKAEIRGNAQLGSESRRQSLQGLWPSKIRLSRARLLNDTVPSLQALAQLLVLQTYSTAGLMSALAGLTYVASPAWALEAGAIAAFGVVYSLRRLQGRWEGARDFWEGEVREEARKALKDTEEMTRGLVNKMGQLQTDPEGVEARRRADEVVLKAEEALAKRLK